MEETTHPLDKYTFDQKIGHGKFAQVFLATKNKQLKAIKKIDLEDENVTLTNLRNEVLFVKKCKHKNIMDILESFCHQNFIYIVMPFMNIGSLENLIQMRKSAILDQNRLEPLLPEEPLFKQNWIGAIFSEICQGIHYLHKNNLIHRDIKSPNIFLNTDGCIKIGDFGIVRNKDYDLISRKTGQICHTFTGTLYWMAPEVMSHQGYSEKIDIWSLGICLLELIMGCTPYCRERPMKVLLRTIRDEPPNLDTYKEFISDVNNQTKFIGQSIRSISRKLLQKDPNLRPSAKKCLEFPFIKKYSDSDNNKKIVRDEIIPTIAKYLL